MYKVSGYEVNIYNLIVSLYTSNEQLKIKILKTIPFTMKYNEKIMYLRLNLIKNEQGLYAENYKTS